LRDIVISTVVLFLVCTIVAVSLAFTNAATRDVILERTLENENLARKEVFSTADDFSKIENLESITAGKDGLSRVKEAYNGTSNGEKAGRVFLIESNGYGGVIKMAAGIDKDGKIMGVKIIEMNETPGLGSKAKEKPFISQFGGINPEEPLAVVKSGKSRDSEINAISGATITSKAVTEGIQAAIDVNTLLNERGDL